MNNSGWIKLHRSLLEWEWYDDLNTKVLFLHCLLKVNHADKKYRGETIKAGTFFTSYQTLADEIGLTHRKVRTALENLEKTGELSYQTSYRGIVVSISKWRSYQDNKNEDVTLNDTPRSDQRHADVNQTSDQRQINVRPTSTNNNIKNIKNIKNEEEFSFSPEASSVEGGEKKTEEVEDSFDDEEKKKVAPKKKMETLPVGLNKKSRDFFEKFYQEKFREKYYFDKINIGQMSLLLKKINFKIKEKQNIEEVSFEQSMEGIKHFINRAYETGDSFIVTNFTLPILSSKFNEIFLKITGAHGKQTNSKNERQQRIDDVAQLRELAKQIIRS